MTAISRYSRGTLGFARASRRSQLDLARKGAGLLLRQRADEPPQRNSGARGTIELQRRRRRKTGVNHPWRIDINVLKLLVLSCMGSRSALFMGLRACFR
jgi:hypothetical protein